MMKPRVVGVIPVHNHEKWVAEAVLSMVRQSYRPASVVVVDDGSTDDSVKSVFRLCDVQPLSHGQATFSEIEGVPVTVIELPEATGPANARNVGMRAGWDDADLFALLDSDDVYEPTKIERGVQTWLKAPGVIGLVYSDFTTFNDQGHSQRQFKEPHSRKLLQECLPNCDSLISKAAVEFVGGFPTHLRTCEDYAVWLKLATRFMPVHIAESLVRIRVGSHSASATVPREDWVRNYRAAFEFAGYKLQ